MIQQLRHRAIRFNNNDLHLNRIEQRNVIEEEQVQLQMPVPINHMNIDNQALLNI